jgi:hypothetical protein
MSLPPLALEALSAILTIAASVAVRKLKLTEMIIEGHYPQFNETLTEH